MPPNSTHSMMIKFVFPTCSSPTENTQTLSVTPEHRLTLDDITEYMKKSLCPWREALNVTFLYNGAAIKTGTLVKDMKLTFPSATINVFFSKRALPAGWSELREDFSGRAYYYCRLIGKTQWEFPTQEHRIPDRDFCSSGKSPAPCVVRSAMRSRLERAFPANTKVKKKAIRAKTKAVQQVTGETTANTQEHDEIRFSPLSHPYVPTIVAQSAVNANACPDDKKVTDPTSDVGSDDVVFAGSKTWEERDQELRKQAITVDD